MNGYDILQKIESSDKVGYQEKYTNRFTLSFVDKDIHDSIILIYKNCKGSKHLMIEKYGDEIASNIIEYLTLNPVTRQR